jgi:cephalosporin hydroxylase
MRNSYGNINTAEIYPKGRKMKKVLATGATENYYNIIVPYINSIHLNSNFDDNILITLDFFKKEQFNKVKHLYLNSDLVLNKNPNNCLQHGEFLKSNYFNSLKNEDIICFTDGDMILQRPLDNVEISLIESLKNGDVLVQFNAGMKDSLLDEYYRLAPRIEHNFFEQNFQCELFKISCYNTGVIICNLKTWNFIQEKYSEYFPKIKDIFRHYAKQQWILSYIINKYLNPIVMDYSMHTHYLHGRIPDTYFINNQSYYKNKKILFSHFCMNIDLPIHKQAFSEQQRKYLESLCPSIKKEIEILKNSNPKNYEDFEQLILSVGLNGELLHEQPSEFSAYYGKGIRIWQYPNQLSKFSQKIFKLKVDSYLEIGCRFGGTFIFNSEMLFKNNSNLKIYACDIIPKPLIIEEYSSFRKLTYLNISSKTKEFKEFCFQTKPEFVFIDGDHSYEGVKNDFNIFENILETKYIAFHDIVSDVCPGVVQIWKEMKEDSRFETYEFTDQYESVKGSFLGIGLAIRK